MAFTAVPVRNMLAVALGCLLVKSNALLVGTRFDIPSRRFAPARTDARVQSHVLMRSSPDKDDRPAREKREPFQFGRFLKTLIFFNGPRRPRLSESPFSRHARRKRRERRMQSKRALKRGTIGRESNDDSLPTHLATDGVVLVTGSTGGVGRRVVQELRGRGIRVRALARNRSKALAMLNRGEEPEDNSDLEIAVANILDRSTLRPAVFQDVSAVISCTAAIVRPKEGDGPDRAKYFQGITFYEPEVADVPEQTEYKGLLNLVSAVKNYSDVDGKTLYACLPSFQDRWNEWGALDDVVMGGVSESNLRIVPGKGEVEGSGSKSSAAAVFSGEVRTSNSGGFVSVRTRNASPPLDLSMYDALKLRVKGDGNRYKFSIYDAAGWNSKAWCDSFDTKADEWIDVILPFETLKCNFRTSTIKDASPISADRIYSFQLMLSKFELDGALNPSFSPGPFELAISSVKAVHLETKGVTPRFIHLSSAGVTRPGRPGIDVEMEPPAVRMNDMLSYLLTYKLKGEDVVRGSGIPATIIRPCALTEEPRGAPMVVAQGDNIKGKISRDDVAELAVSSLLDPAASGKTFEVKSDLAFSTIWTGKTEDGDIPPPRDYGHYFGSLEGNVTGKEWMGDMTPEEAAGVKSSATQT